MLAIDGGGVRGIISLELLLRLEGWLDVPYPVWHFFDLVVGTSAGKYNRTHELVKDADED